MKHTKLLSPSSVKAYGLLLFFVVFLGACKPPKNDGPDLQSAVNVVNGIIGSAPIAFYINKLKVEGATLKYTDESGYFITFPGTRDLDVAAEGTSGNIFTTNINLQQNTYHTVFLCGEAGSVTSLFTTDDLTAPPAGKAKIRFVNLSPDGGALTLGLKAGTTLVANQEYKTASQFITLDPGLYDVQLKSSTGTVYAEMSITVVAGTIYTAWSKGLRSGANNTPIGLQYRSIN